ncbi:unnamed protein product [Didymodactylos carnosus]|uniref:Uncharacterized protein n=1 Tax=Didymodactylos carnosus TaxID=1234261 RepID=A0A8S2DLT8_9BILA|nr:unnamed protein product [Didymodactylos carnosus]CAF3726158.1 unnamed protein product [Didymodactylos carnosus]
MNQRSTSASDSPLVIHQQNSTFANNQSNLGIQQSQTQSCVLPQLSTGIEEGSQNVIDGGYITIGAKRKSGKQGNATTTIDSDEVSTEARRFAETRYPFPPFLVKFKEDIKESNVINESKQYMEVNYNVQLEFEGYKLKGKQELLLFVKNRESFVILFGSTNWPSTLCSLDFQLVVPRRLPPQFSIMLRNVAPDMDTSQLLMELQQVYPDIINASRIFNKDNGQTTLVRLDIQSVKIIDELLRKKFVYLYHSRHPVSEYLVPAKCKICGLEVDDLKKHREEDCDNLSKCVRCNESHDSNGNRCPTIRSYRSILTKQLLRTTETKQVKDKDKGTAFQHNNNDFPPMDAMVNINRYNRNGWVDGKNDERLSRLEKNVGERGEEINRLLKVAEQHDEQLRQMQHVIQHQETRLEQYAQNLTLLNVDIKFYNEFLGQFITPVCQAMLEIIPALVNKQTLNTDTTASLISLYDKLADERAKWSGRQEKDSIEKRKILATIGTLLANNKQTV